MAERPEDGRAQHRIDTQMLSDMWIFRAVAGSESITGAAEQLNVTQSAVSQRVSRLESRLGTQLFVRDRSGLSLTEPGAALSRALNQVAFLLNDALDEIHRPETRSIVVSCAPTLATEWLVPKLEEFYRLHPGIEVFVRSEMLAATSKRLQAEGVDLVISYQPAPPTDLQELASFQELAFPVCSRSYRTALEASGEGAPVLLYDDMPWGVNGGPPTEWDAWRVASGLKWPQRQGGSRHFNLAHLAYHAAVFNQGVALGRAVVVHRLLSRGELVSALSAAPIPEAIYRISSAQSGEVRPWTRLFANWWRDAMQETQQRTLSLLKAD
jgi:LysR family glycine cleavage system transcriptional activator